MLFWPSVYPPGWFEVGPDNVFRVDAPIWLALLPPDSPTTKHPFVRTDPPTADPRAAADQLVGVINLDSGIRNRLNGPLTLATCHNCGKMTAGRCGGCQSAFSCSKECQVKDWPLHKVKCERNKDVNEKAKEAAGKMKVSQERESGFSILMTRCFQGGSTNLYTRFGSAGEILDHKKF